MIQAWIDSLVDVWAGISDQRFGSVRSFHLLKKAEFPEAINPADDFPCAITIPGGLDPGDYGVGSPKVAVWNGVTEFHLTPDLNKKHLPAILPWYGLIWAAAAANPTLDGNVELFWIISRADGINGPLALRYGAEAPHWGLIVNWMVKEPVNDEIKVSMP